MKDLSNETLAAVIQRTMFGHASAGFSIDAGIKIWMRQEFYFAFTPNTLMVPAGQEITIKVTNNGAVAHDLMIIKLGDELSSHDHVGSDAHANADWEQNQLEP